MKKQKQILSEQFQRMQKLAGILNESVINEMKQYYHVLEDGGYGEIGHQGVYDTKEEAQNRVNELSDMFPDNSFYIEASDSQDEPYSVTSSDYDPNDDFDE